MNMRMQAKEGKVSLAQEPEEPNQEDAKNPMKTKKCDLQLDQHIKLM